MTYAQIILATAKIVKVPGALLLAICMQETGLKNSVAPHDGGSPSVGICQVKLSTAQFLGFKGTHKDLMSPSTNAKYAALYLKYQLDRYSYDYCQATAAYNSGSFNESQKMPGYPRNLKYVRSVQNKMHPTHRYKLACGERE